MSFVTFVRDYVQDPDKIISIPNLVFDVCKEFVWYVFTFQWLRNLTYVTLSYPNSNSLNLSSLAYSEGVYRTAEQISKISPSPQSQVLDQGFIETCRENITNFLNQSTHQVQNFSLLTNKDSILNTSFESNLLKTEQLSYFHNFLYGLFNGIISNFHFCAVTILIIHILLNENKQRAFRITLASCFGDISYIIAILFGYRGIIAPWLVLEPLTYFLGFALQFFFALEIIKDNSRIKNNFDRQLDRKPLSSPPAITSNDSMKGIARNNESGQLSFNRWLIPSLILFSWCEQTQIFQTGSQFSLQPTATLLEMSYPGGLGLNSIVSQSSIGFGRELQILIYLSTFIFTRIVIAWFCLSIFQSLINWEKNNSGGLGFASKNSNLFSIVKELPSNIASLAHKLLIPNERQKIALYIKNRLVLYSTQFYGYGINKTANLFLGIKSLFIPRSLQKQTNFVNNLKSSISTAKVVPGYMEDVTTPLGGANTFAIGQGLNSESFSSQAKISLNSQKRKGLQHTLRDLLAVAAVTCSLAFLPAYSTNLLVTKSIGFFPEENRTKHSLFSPWDMPATVLASDMDFISNHPNHAEYPFFLPFYDKGNYGGWLGMGEEDIRYGPFRLWQSRRIRAPWRKTTLQEPALTFANDKSLFINPLLRTPDLKNNSIQGKEVTANIKNGISLSPLTNQKWEYLWKHFKIQSAYTKLFAINNAKLALPLKQNQTVNLITPNNGDKNFSSINKSSLNSSLIMEHKDLYSQKIIKTQNLKLTKAGRKRLVEVLKKPLRKLTTSSFFNLNPVTDSVPNSFGVGPRANAFGISTVYPPRRSEKVRHTSSMFGSTNQETKIKHSKQIRKRFKNFKKKLRLFRTRAYKKRTTKIKKLKHFNSLRNKKKKLRKSRRLIYKLRRQYPYVRNIKQRKAETFGLYSSASNIFPVTQQGLEQVNGISNKVMPDVLSEKTSYLTEYPKKKNSINLKKDFNLIFRTQIGERLDFAQEEIRARIFINPYVRFLLNNRIDNLMSRSSSMGNKSTLFVKSFPSSSIPVRSSSTTSLGTEPLGIKTLRSPPSVKAPEAAETENNLFKRRLLISKYADAVNFLKPSLHHSYVDRVYNHQFKGTLATARRLFSLKIQYDQPLIHSSNYKSAIKHEDLLNSLNSQNSQDINGVTLAYPEKIRHGAIPDSNLLEKNYSAPLYGAWDPKSQKLILTNRYLNYKKATTFAAYPEGVKQRSPLVTPPASVIPSPMTSLAPIQKQNPREHVHEGDHVTKNNKLSNQGLLLHSANNKAILFSNWPLKESYFKDNEFLVSQLYSNSQPIDSFLSQENEKARPVALPRRVNSLNTVLNYKNNVQPTDAQRSQQFLKIENNDKKTFLFKHFWNNSNTANELVTSLFKTPKSLTNIGAKQSIPISAEQRKTTRMDEREYPLWMVLRALPPNQGGFLWPGD